MATSKTRKNAAYLGKPAHLRTRDERAEAGRALRVSCPRESHAGFSPAEDRSDPIVASRHNGHKPAECRAAAAAVVGHYRDKLRELAEMTDDAELKRRRRKVLDKALARDAAAEFVNLAHIEGGKPRMRDDVQRYRDSLPRERHVLFDRYEVADVAIKVVGVGSVGTLCAVVLFFAAEDDPLFLQVKEARDSVLAPYVDVKVKPLIEIFTAQNMLGFARNTGWALARAHARSGDAAVIAGYIGKGEVLADAIAEFAVDYADQNERDHAALLAAVRAGRVEAETEDE